MNRSRLALAGALFAAVLAALPAPAEECIRPFWGAESIEAYGGGGPRESVVEDFDGNGLPDVAVTNGVVKVSLRQPSGLYLSTTYAVGSGPTAMAAADVDGDGDVDLVVVNSSDNTLSVLKNGGRGSFTASQTIAPGMQPYDIALGDLDGDGDVDLVASGFAAAREVAVFANAGGTFAFSRQYLVAGNPGTVVIADLDADAARDVAVSADDGSISVLWNTGGTGDLSAPHRLLAAASPASLVVGDVNGDGRPDLLTAHEAAGVELHANLGGRTFAPPVALVAGVLATTIALADADGDGDLDLAITSKEPSPAPAGLSLYLNAGAGAFALAERVETGEWPYGLAFADLDGDGDPDVTVSARLANSVLLYANVGGHLLAARRNPTGGVAGATALTHGDLDGDGRPELIVAERSTLQVLSHVGAGALGAPVVYPMASGTWLVDVAAGDVDGDGDLDVVIADQTADVIGVMKNAGGGALSAPVPFAVCGTSLFTFRLADTDGDHDLDAVVTCNTAQVRVYPNDGSGAFASYMSASVGAGPLAPAVADFDGDGDRDLAVPAGFADNVVVVTQTPGNTWSPGWSTTDCDGPFSIAAGDIDGDGRIDMAVTCSAGARVHIYRNAGAGAFTLAQAWIVIDGGKLELADLDGDGDRDLAVIRGNDRSVVVYDNDGAGHFSAAGAYATDASPWRLAAADLDGDGDLDLTTVGRDNSAPTATVLVNTRVGCPSDVSLSVAGGTVPEGASGVASLPFTVALSTSAAWPVTVDYATSDGTATAADYAPASGTLTFAPGETQKTVAVLVNGDEEPEADETVLLEVSNASGAPVETAQASGTITDDDGGAAVTLTVDLVSHEGGHGFVFVSPPALDGATLCDDPSQGPGPFTCTFLYAPGTEVTLQASPYPGSAFQQFDGACTGTGPCTVTLAGPGPGGSVGASFLGPRTLTVDLVSHEGGHGFVFVSPPALDGATLCDDPSQGPGPVTCTFRYTPGTEVTLQASPYPGSAFQQFDGACTGTGPCAVTLAGPGPGGSVDASFLGPRTLTVDLVSHEGGHGFVFVSPPALDGATLCDDPSQGPGPVTCTFRYTPGTEVTLQASPYPGSAFQQFDGACTGTGPCAVTLAGPGPGGSVDASFLGPRTLTVDLVSHEGGHGFVFVSPPALDGATLCDDPSQGPGPVTCTFRYTPGTEVTLQASPYPGSAFQQFDGACTGTGPCAVTLAGPGPGGYVDASFLGPRTLTTSLTSVGGGHGTLTVSPLPVSGSDSCALPSGQPSASCSFAYTPDTAVTVTAVPAPGSVLSAMGGACPATGPCVVTMSSHATVTASFALENHAPTAHAGGSYAGVRGQAIVFDGSGSSDPDGQPLTYLWTFSDGGTATGVSPTHAFGALGTHTATLVVSDGITASAPSAATVTIENAVPSVALTSPADGSTHPESGPIVLAADALDSDGSVVRVAFYAGTALVGEALAPPFTAAWSGSKPGAYVVTARATDSDGATTTSAPRTVHVNPGPTVALTSPANGAVFVAGATVVLAATASDDLGVARVEFYAGTTLVGSDTSSPYEVAWPGVPAGRRVLSARAVDTTGNVTVSTPVTINVLPAAADSQVRPSGSRRSTTLVGAGTPPSDVPVRERTGQGTRRP